MEGCSTSDKVRPRHRNNYSNDSLLQALSVKSTYYQTNPNYRSSQLEAKEAQLLQWEARLKKKQQELDEQRIELKRYSKQLEEESSNIVREKLELNRKLQKYCHVLEQINGRCSPACKQDKSVFIVEPMRQNRPSQHSPKQSSMFSISNPHNSRLQTQAIQNCQSRIANLLHSIKKSSTSQSRLKNAQKPYCPPANDRDIQEYLFGGSTQSQTPLNSNIYGSSGLEQSQQERSIKINDDRLTQDQVIRVPSAECLNKTKVHHQDQLLNTTESEKEIHDLKLKSIQMNEQLFYRKIQMEVDKLKALKQKML